MNQEAHTSAPSPDHHELDDETDADYLPQHTGISLPPHHPPFSDLPPFLLLQSRKRELEDEAIGNSSDTPLFSSDDIPASSENYTEHRNKRQRKKLWWDHSKPGYQPTVRRKSKRVFKRNMDSGVWMGSDSDIEDELHVLNVDTSRPSKLLPQLALETLEDPGNFSGPVFPYWDDQPDYFEEFWGVQKTAVDYINKCVDDGIEVIDLKFGPLTESSARWQDYSTLSPKLQIYLAGNRLSRLPGRLFQLQAITVLSLRNNNITELPAAIGNLVNLSELNVSNNNLRWLPYEIRELLQRNLRFLGFHPNPFIRAMSRFINPISPTAALCSTEPTIQHIDGTLARDSPPSPVTTSTHWPESAPTGQTQMHTNKEMKTSIPRFGLPRSRPLHKVPSLFETSLRTCYNLPQLSQLPFLVPTPEATTAALKHAWHVKQEGGQRCTICNSSFIIPRTEWIEWWQLAVKAEPLVSQPPSDEDYRLLGSPVPLLRRGCSWSCAPGVGGVGEGIARTGWCPAKGMEEI
ncbi:MAG: hypothetical protein Q9170_004653 [Blastenia crenularia]